MSSLITNFTKLLAPSLQRAKVMDDLDQTIDLLEKKVLPSYKDASDFFRLNRILSPEAKEIQTKLYANFKPKPKSNTFISDVHKALENILDNLKYIKAEAPKILEPDIIPEGLTYKRALYLRAIDYCTYVSRYAGDLLSYTYFFEMKAEIKEDVHEGTELSPAMLARVDNGIFDFGAILEKYGMENSKFKIIFSEIKDVNLSKDSAVLEYYLQENGGDVLNVPLTAGFIPNPIYHARMMFAEWQNARYKRQEAQARSHSIRLLHLKLVKEKNGSNAKLEQQIKYYEDEVVSLDKAMSEYEENLGILRQRSA